MDFRRPGNPTLMDRGGRSVAQSHHDYYVRLNRKGELKPEDQG